MPLNHYSRKWIHSIKMLSFFVLSSCFLLFIFFGFKKISIVLQYTLLGESSSWKSEDFSFKLCQFSLNNCSSNDIFIRWKISPSEWFSSTKGFYPMNKFLQRPRNSCKIRTFDFFFSFLHSVSLSEDLRAWSSKKIKRTFADTLNTISTREFQWYT